MFFRKKSKSKHSYSLSCPFCSRKQEVPQLAFSTNCKHCGEYFRIENHKPVDTTVSNSLPKILDKGSFSKQTKQVTDIGSCEEEDRPSEASEKIGESSEEITKASEGIFDFNSEKALKNRYSAQEDKYSKRNYKHEQRTKSIRCYNCDESHNIIPKAASSMCPVCGTHISLENFIIEQNWNREICTRGDVTIRKGGGISNSSIACHNLKIIGEFSGEVDCSGTLEVLNRAELSGRCVSNYLVVNKKANVNISQILYAKEIKIFGVVEGNLYCHGKVFLASSAKIHGDISAASIVIKEGAYHEGSLSMKPA